MRWGIAVGKGHQRHVSEFPWQSNPCYEHSVCRGFFRCALHIRG